MSQEDFLVRHMVPYIESLMGFMRIVAITGPRQSGKSTLSKWLAEKRGMMYISLDESRWRKAAATDPEGLMLLLSREGGVIDEVQLEPDLIFLLKIAVDNDRRPGQFIITGSVDMFGAFLLPDTLAGRVFRVNLLPFSQREIDRSATPSHFLSTVFRGNFPLYDEWTDSSDVWQRALRGGYPDAVLGKNAALKRKWVKGYLDVVLERHLRDEFEVYKTQEFRKLVTYLAEIAGGLVNLSAIGGQLGVNYQTIRRWMWLLEQMYIIRQVPMWRHKKLASLRKAPKLCFLDSGLLANLRGWKSIDPLLDFDRKGALLENFVFAELTRFVCCDSEWDTEIYCFRNSSGVEVDFVLKSYELIVGIEVKASSSTVSSSDFKGLRLLKDQLQEKFVCGIVIYTGNVVHRFGEKLFAVPVSALWSDDASPSTQDSKMQEGEG